MSESKTWGKGERGRGKGQRRTAGGSSTLSDAEKNMNRRPCVGWTLTNHGLPSVGFEEKDQRCWVGWTLTIRLAMKIALERCHRGSVGILKSAIIDRQVVTVEFKFFESDTYPFLGF